MLIALWVAIGSAMGGLARYGVGVWLAGVVPLGLPAATFLVNLVGSAALGFLIGRQQVMTLPPHVYMGLTTGLLGGFTTYSTFNAELLRMALAGDWGRLVAYASLTLLACFVGGYLGMLLGGRGG